MIFALGMLLGIAIGMTMLALTSANKINELLDNSYNAELRAVTHFRKLQEIERIIKQDEKNKEFAVFTVKRIKEVINDRKINQ